MVSPSQYEPSITEPARRKIVWVGDGRQLCSDRRGLEPCATSSCTLGLTAPCKVAGVDVGMAGQRVVVRDSGAGPYLTRPPSAPTSQPGWEPRHLEQSPRALTTPPFTWISPDSHTHNPVARHIAVEG